MRGGLATAGVAGVSGVMPLARCAYCGEELAGVTLLPAAQAFDADGIVVERARWHQRYYMEFGPRWRKEPDGCWSHIASASPGDWFGHEATACDNQQRRLAPWSSLGSAAKRIRSLAWGETRRIRVLCPHCSCVNTFGSGGSEWMYG
jgi:hypothetical protein